MEEDTARRLAALNAAFYERFAAEFAASRGAPSPGFARLLPYADGAAAILDVGCGDGRFLRYLLAKRFSPDYTGVDGSETLLAAAAGLPGAFFRRDLSRSNSLVDLGQFDLVVCLATLQHIPGRAQRARLLAEMARRLRPGGYVALSNWQFVDSPRQRRKVRPWAEAQIDEAAVEAGDYLLSWRRGGYGVRYAAHIDAEATARLADDAGLRIVEQFRSDGREGDLSLYTVLRL